MGKLHVNVGTIGPLSQSLREGWGEGRPCERCALPESRVSVRARARR